MSERCLLYYVTDRSAFPGDDGTRHSLLLEKISEAASAGVDYVQLREKDLTSRELESLAREAMRAIGGRKTALLINSRTDVALAVGAHGVHLRAEDVSPKEVRDAWQKCGAGVPAREIRPHAPLISISCHSPAQAFAAAANGSTVALFAPVFEKKDAPATIATGLENLGEACQARIPVLALGGITLENASSCLRAGASGIAAIRLFQENEITTIMNSLRNL